MSKDKDCDCKWKDDYKDKSDLYIPLGNHDTEFENSSMKALLAKLVKGSESKEITLKRLEQTFQG